MFPSTQSAFAELYWSGECPVGQPVVGKGPEQTMRSRSYCLVESVRASDEC